MIHDLTVGKPSKLLIKFTLPMFLGIVFQQLYSIADSVVVGQFAQSREAAVAAIGASYSITMIFLAIAAGANIGCSIVISQLFGAKDYKDMKTAITTSIIGVMVVAALLTVLGLIFSDTILTLLNTPAKVFDDSAIYLKVYIGGLAFLFLYNICTGVFTALGDSRTPFYFLLASSLGNIALNLIFVICFAWDVAGVAWATFICQGIASILSLIVLLRRLRRFHSTERPVLFSAQILKKISRMAIPSILQQSFVSVGNLLVQYVVNGFGAEVLAGYSSAIRLNTFAITSFSTISSAVSSFSAQNVGAGKMDRVEKGWKVGITMGLVVALPFLILYLLFSTQMAKLFVRDPSPQALETTVTFLRIVALFYPAIMFKLVCDGVLRGAGVMREFMIATFADLLLRVILSYALSGPFGSIGVWTSWPIGWTLAAVLSYIFYKKGKWKKSLL